MPFAQDLVMECADLATVAVRRLAGSLPARRAALSAEACAAQQPGARAAVSLTAPLNSSVHGGPSLRDQMAALGSGAAADAAPRSAFSMAAGLLVCGPSADDVSVATKVRPARPAPHRPLPTQLQRAAKLPRHAQRWCRARPPRCRPRCELGG
jgi:hypothetical protein